MFNKIKNMRLSAKLPAINIAAALITAIVVGLLAYMQARDAFIASIDERLSLISQARAAEFEGYLHTIDEDADIIARNPFVQDAVRDLSTAFAEFGRSATRELQTLYTEDNPHPPGEKQKLDAAADGSTYSAYHAKYHPWLRTVLKDRGYYDIFLFDLQGNLIYSVAKEADYATNFLRGEYKDSGLGSAYRSARAAGDSHAVHFADFKPYAPSNGAAAGFLSTPIFDANETMIGILAFQMPTGRINKIMNHAEGLGETGLVELVGSDLLMRNQSRLTDVNTILVNKIDSKVVRAALDGQLAVDHVYYKGRKVLQAAAPLEFHGTKMAVTAQIDDSEVLAPVYALRNAVLIVTLVVLTVIGAVGFFISRQTTKAIGNITAQMNAVAEGNLDVDVDIERQDEIGDMARAVEVFKANGKERIALEEANRRGSYCA